MSATSQVSNLQQISEILAAQDVIVHHGPEANEPVAGTFSAPEAISVTHEVQNFLATQYSSGLYSHQAEAIASIQSRRHTVTATRTSSGKSLIFSLPVWDSLCRDASSTALFIYPQKALANDQLLKMNQTVMQLPSLAKIARRNSQFISRYDGSTPSGDTRSLIRKHAQVILTNPDMLHYAMLQYHDSHWARYFANLKHIAIDECHEYRGIFGTNVAYILRRLRQVCNLHGSDPTFIATSATIHEPREHMEHLTGLPFECVGPERDGSRQGRRKYWMVSSANEHYYDFGRKLALKLADEGLTVLAFCPGRVSAERMMARVLSQKDTERPYVRVYRAGLSGDERQEIENGLRDKSVRLVFSTSALELGIDIGEVDAVVCIGLPNSMMSLWQRAGRAARGGREGGVILIPADTPIDSYYAKHPVELFSKDNEPLVLNTSNRRVVCQHYACATAEVGGDEDLLEANVLGESIAAVRELRREGRLDLDVFYRADPHMHVNIRSMGEGNYSLECGRDVIGEIDEVHLLREAYRNAIYRHGGKGYRVKDVIRGKRKVILDREYSWNDTTPFINKKIRLKRRHRIADYKQLMVATVAMDVTEFLVNVIEKDRSGKTLSQWPGNAGMPTNTLPTEGTMLMLRSPLWQQFSNKFGPQVVKSALQSCERLFAALFPTTTGPCDRQDYSSASEIGQDGSASIYLYDMVYDGVDLTPSAFDYVVELTDKVLDRLSNCECEGDEGCFRCIANPHTQEVTSKAATLELLRLIHQQLNDSVPKLTENPEAANPFEEVASPNPCPTCGAASKSNDRFCSNCGSKLGNEAK